jgi:hypothetical protein
MTAGERRLAAILIIACAASAATVALALGLERIGDARSQIQDYRQRIARLSNLSIDEAGAGDRLQKIESLIGKAENRVSVASKTPLSSFGHEVMDLLSSSRIAPAKYQVVSGAKGDQLEFSFQCETGDLLRFMRKATESDDGWTIPYVSIHAEASYGRADVVIRLAQ